MHRVHTNDKAGYIVYLVAMAIWYVNALVSFLIVPYLVEVYATLHKACPLGQHWQTVLSINVMLLVYMLFHFARTTSDTWCLRATRAMAWLLVLCGVCFTTWTLIQMNVLIIPAPSLNGDVAILSSTLKVATDYLTHLCQEQSRVFS